MSNRRNRVIPSLKISEAVDLQFKLTESIGSVFKGDEFLSLGDVGITPVDKQPSYTTKVEEVFSVFFDVEATSFVRGSGTGAIRSILSALLNPNERIIVHQAPIYSTTKETLQQLAIETVSVDYNDLEALEEHLKMDNISKVFYVQHARQQLLDNYDIQEVIQKVKFIRPDLKIVVDDNYCVLKTNGIGTNYGADYSTFSAFKLLGPEGVGVVLGKNDGIKKIKAKNYSGGSKVQGYETMEFLRMMIYAPISFAIQSEQVDKVSRILNQGEIEEIQKAYPMNAQSKVIIVELKQPIAKKIIENSNQFGAANYPVGAESKYEILPMIYRVSGSFIDAAPSLKEYGLRINPMKSGAEQVIKILKKSIALRKDID